MAIKQSDPATTPVIKDLLCPMRSMEPFMPQCAWNDDGICAVLNLSHEAFYAVEALRAVAGVESPAPVSDESGDTENES